MIRAILAILALATCASTSFGAGILPPLPPIDAGYYCQLNNAYQLTNKLVVEAWPRNLMEYFLAQIRLRFFFETLEKESLALKGEKPGQSAQGLAQMNLSDLYLQQKEFARDSNELDRFIYEALLKKLSPAKATRQEYEYPGNAFYYHHLISPTQRLGSLVMVSYAYARSTLPLKSRLKILDLGAGVGDTIFAIRAGARAGHEMTALDYSQAFLFELGDHIKPAPPTVLFDFAKHPMPFAEASFDFITSITAASLYLDTTQFMELLADVHRMLKPGGYFLFDLGPGSKAWQMAGSIEKFLELAKAKGFEAENQIGLEVRFGNAVYVPILLKRLP